MEPQDVHNPAIHTEKDINGHDHATGAAAQRRRQYEYGGNPLAHIATNDSSLNLQAFGGLLQPVSDRYTFVNIQYSSLT